MPRPPIPQEEIDRVKRLWITEGRPSAEKLLEKDNHSHGIRKYQQWAAEARREIKDIPEDQELAPWGDGWPRVRTSRGKFSLGSFSLPIPLPPPTQPLEGSGHYCLSAVGCYTDSAFGVFYLPSGSCRGCNPRRCRSDRGTFPRDVPPCRRRSWRSHSSSGRKP